MPDEEAPPRPGDVRVSRGTTAHPSVRAQIRRVGPRGVQFHVISGPRHGRRDRPYALVQAIFRQQLAPRHPSAPEEEA
jgi:hypothetical protein